MFQDPHIKIIAKLVGGAAIIALLAYTYVAFTQARQISHMPMSITVDGKGEIMATPDIATFNFSVTAKEDDAATAQSSAATRMNEIVAYLKEKGVEEKDIKTTGYYLNPRYEYAEVRCMDWGCPPASEPKIIGYEVSQSIDVKVRKTDDAGMLISGVGEKGAMNVGGLMFTIDDEESLKTKAREAAIADAQAKAKDLADKLGVKIVRMNGYWEDQGSYPMYYGGDMARNSMKTESTAVAPDLPLGENTISSMVHITYEVR